MAADWDDEDAFDAIAELEWDEMEAALDLGEALADRADHDRKVRLENPDG